MKEYVTEIVAAYVGKNHVQPADIPALIVNVSQALSDLGRPAAAPVAPAPSPAVPIRRSVGAETITCLECGWSGQMLKRHLTSAHGLSVADYRARWGLALHYPMVAKNYADRRSELAKAIGLGRRPRGR